DNYSDKIYGIYVGYVKEGSVNVTVDNAAISIENRGVIQNDPNDYGKYAAIALDHVSAPSTITLKHADLTYRSNTGVIQKNFFNAVSLSHCSGDVTILIDNTVFNSMTHGITIVDCTGTVTLKIQNCSDDPIQTYNTYNQNQQPAYDIIVYNCSSDFTLKLEVDGEEKGSRTGANGKYNISQTNFN
ncbi:MAG: hypothetical protein KBS81_03250, partial [Spirochaetales bacterium]|nr:hypothetical protein [Candidatus Physcosoma equi]